MKMYREFSEFSAHFPTIAECFRTSSFGETAHFKPLQLDAQIRFWTLTGRTYQAQFTQALKAV